MSRNKAGKWLSLSLAAILFLSPVVSASETQEKDKSEPQDIIDLTQIENENELISETAQVERGSFIVEDRIIAHKYYPMVYNLSFDQTGAKFLEFTVKTRDVVKKGDVLARFTTEKREAEYTQLSLDLQRAEEQFADGVREREAAIEAKRAALNAAADEYEKEILSLTVQKLETELKQYKHRQQRSINQKGEALAKERERRTTDVLVSPVDGVVKDYAFKRVDDAVMPGETLITVVSGESVLYLAENQTLSLRYNMPVRVKVEGQDDVYLSGRVVAADDAIPRDERTGYALIELDPYDEKKYKVSDSPFLIAESTHVGDVLLVPNKAVEQEGDKWYVEKLTDGVLQKRYVEPAFNNGQNTWILSGVEEGETLVLG